MEHEYLTKLRKWQESGHELHVHQVIVCSQSRFFEIACSGSFEEASTKIIHLQDDLPSVQRMISYMYTFDYDDHDFASISSPVVEIDDKDSATPPVESGRNDSELFSSVRVYAIAGKYDIPGLKTLALSKFAMWVEKDWSSVHYPAMVEEAFSTTPAEDMGLKEVIVESVVQHISLLNQAEWQDVIADNDFLCRKILDQMAKLLVEVGSRLSKEQEEYRSQLEILENEKNTLSARLSTVIENVSKTKTCRHCSTKFDAFLEAPNATLRCRECRTRHY